MNPRRRAGEESRDGEQRAMRKTKVVVWAVCVVCLMIVGCGSDEEAPPDRTKIKTIGKTSRKDGATTDVRDMNKSAKPPPVSVEDAKNRTKIELFEKRLKDASNSDDRAEVLGDIAEFGKEGKILVSKVRPCLEDKDPVVREETLHALAAIDPLGCRPFLEKGLKDDEESVRMAAVKAWTNAPLKDLTPLFAHLLDEIETNVQFAIAVAVRKHGQDYHVNQVVLALEEVSISAARPFIDFLVAMKAVDHVGVLMDYLGKSDASVRVAAGRGLGEMGVKSKTVYRALSTGLEDDDERVRRVTFESLKRLTQQDFGFVANADESSRMKAVSAWRDWVKKQK